MTHDTQSTDVFPASGNPINKNLNISNILFNLYKDVNRTYLMGLQGEVLTLLDAMGLPEAQSKAVKDTVKKYFRSVKSDLINRFHDNYHQILVEQMGVKLDVPPTVVDFGGDSQFDRIQPAE